MRINFASLFEGIKKTIKKLTSRAKTGPAVPLEQDQAMIQNLNESRWPSLTQFTYIFRYLNKSEGLIFRLSIFLLFASAALLVGRYIQRHWIPEPAIGGSYTEAIFGTPRLINPVLASSDLDLQLTPLIYNGLLRLDANGEYVNDLAEKIETSNDGKTYTVNLKPGLIWQDDQTLTSDDVRFTIETIQNPNIGSPLYSKFRDIKIETPDDKKIILKLEKNDGNFEKNLTLGILPAHIWTEIPPAAMNTTEFNLKPIGSGPFMFKEIRKKEKSGDVTSMTLERFVQTATPTKLKSLMLKFVQDGTAALDLISSGQANGMRLISSDLFAKAEKIRGGKIAFESLPQVVNVFFNFKNKLLANKSVRLALRSAIDVNEIITKVRPDADFIVGPVLAGMPGGEAVNSASPQDLNGAIKLLEDAGWKKENEVFVKDKTTLEFSLTVPDIKEYTSAAEIIATAWKNLGAKVEIKKIDPAIFGKEVIKTRNFDAILYADRYDTDLSLYPFWHSTQSFDPGLNLTSYYNKDLDQLLTQTQKSDQKPEALAELNKKIQTLINDEVPAIFLYQPSAMLVNTVNLRSTIQPSLLTASNHFLDISGWYTETRHTWKWNP